MEELRQFDGAIDEIIEKYKGKQGSIIPVLEEVQGIVGFLPKEVQYRVADGLNISRSIVYGIVTFYSFFSIKPRGRNIIRVCLGTACYVKGAEAILSQIKKCLIALYTKESISKLEEIASPKETPEMELPGITPDRRFSLEVVRCVGACGLAPIIMINEDVHGHVDPEKIKKTLEGYK